MLCANFVFGSFFKVTELKKNSEIRGILNEYLVVFVTFTTNKIFFKNVEKIKLDVEKIKLQTVGIHSKNQDYC